MQNGVRTTDLPTLSGLDGVLGNRDGTTGVLPFAALVSLVGASLGPAYETVALLDADLDWPAGVLATVWGEASDDINGVYQKAGAAGEGSWSRIGALPVTPLSAALLALKADIADLDVLEAQIASIAVGLSPAGPWDPTAGTFPAGSATNTFYVVSANGTVDGQTFAAGDWLIALVSAASTTTFAPDWMRADYADVVANAFIDPVTLSVGALAETEPQRNTLHIATDGEISDGGLDYGLTISALEPGIALVDRSAGAGQSLISGDAGQIGLFHDPVNQDGTIGGTFNTDTVPSALFAPGSQRFYVDGVEQLLLDNTGLQLGGLPVATEDYVDAVTAPFLSLTETATWNAEVVGVDFFNNFVPVLSFTVAYARYTRCGDRIALDFRITSIEKGAMSGSNSIAISQLPFAPDDTNVPLGIARTININNAPQPCLRATTYNSLPALSLQQDLFQGGTVQATDLNAAAVSVTGQVTYIRTVPPP